MERVYAGVGSRKAPDQVLRLARRVGARLAELGWVLRTGGAPGMDRAFEEGAREAGGRVQIFLPWPGYEGYREDDPAVALDRPPFRGLPAGGEVSPRLGGRLGRGVKALMARNAHQILGPGLDDPVRFVVCWTPDGAEEATGPETGGTGQAIRMAVAMGVPVFNLARPDALERLARLLR